eukprot:5939436-Prymnesium_polylepis.1
MLATTVTPSHRPTFISHCTLEPGACIVITPLKLVAPPSSRSRIVTGLLYGAIWKTVRGVGSRSAAPLAPS